MTKWIVSVVMTKLTPPENAVIMVEGRPMRNPHAQPDISLQNIVGIVDAEDSNGAWAKFSQHARGKFPDHKISVRVVIEASEAQLQID